MREMVGGCCVCSDDRGWPENPLVYCDGQSCTVAVHQACYGIVTVPTGPWFCRKCESQEKPVKVKCELCPSKHGALKRTDNQGWAHVVCALYIPEVRFGNVTTMEPIQLQLIPPERFNKVCYICEEKGRPANASIGACMQCNKAGCKQQFHVTCAQGLGLLCEEAGNYLDNVKYCGYCQHHYSKLKKGGNVKTIPPYKPVSDTHLSDSNSEKEIENNSSTGKSSSSTTASNKRKSSSSGKTSSSSSSSKTTSNSKSSSSTQKATHSSSSKSSDKSSKLNSNIKSAKSVEDSVNADSTVESKTDKKDSKSESVDSVEQKEIRDKNSKKRKTNSRTPTPISVVPSEPVSVVVTSVSSANTDSSAIVSTASLEKKDAVNTSESPEKPKKPRVETTQSILINQPVVALTSISTIKTASPATTVSEAGAASEPVLSAVPTQSIVHSLHGQQVNSLVVSVPLANTSLSPHPQIINNQTSVVTSVQNIQPEGSSNSGSIERSPSEISAFPPTTASELSNTMLGSEMSGAGNGGLKITYEKQDSVAMEVDMELEVSATEDAPIKRSRSQSTDKIERGGRAKKRNSANGISSSLSNPATTMTKRSSRSQQSLQQAQQSLQQSQQQPGAFASISQSQIKDSPPSSPSSESQGATSTRSRAKNRKSAPAAVTTVSNASKDNKDVKIFQNGLNAPHMMGNQLNPNSNMAQKMSDHLNSELEAHSIFNPNENNSNLIGPQLHHRVIAQARASSAASSTGSGGSGLSSMLGGAGGTIPQTLDQLLERQWEQGSQFLMEQAQHFDIASLLSCLHQLRAENLRLEEHVSSLIQRRDHLLAVNARLAIPLTGQPVAPQTSHGPTVNNIHPAVASTSTPDLPRPSRHGGSGSSYPGQSMNNTLPVSAPLENGLPPEQSYPHSHRSPATASQPQRSPTVRW